MGENVDEALINSRLPVSQKTPRKYHVQNSFTKTAKEGKLALYYTRQLDFEA